MTIIEEGSLAEVTEEFEHDGRTFRVGDKVTIEDYMPHSDDPEEYSHAYYASDRGGMYNVVAPADNVRVVKTVKEMLERRLPTAEEIAKALVSDLCGVRGVDWETSGAGPAYEDSVDVEGETRDGLSFGFTVTITAVERMDY